MCINIILCCSSFGTEEVNESLTKVIKISSKVYGHDDRWNGSKENLFATLHSCSKDVDEDTFVQLHLVRYLIYNGAVQPNAFITYPNIHNDPNLTVSMLNKVLHGWGKQLPHVLYLQLDNTTRQNKNSTLFGYLSILVELEVFKKVKINFPMVGHAHDHINQMFGTFSKKLVRNNDFTMGSLIDIFSSTYSPRPRVCHLPETYDFK
jgi:hypothetical protein